MKSKFHLTLMELLIMLAVFSLAAALCLQVFAASDRVSRENSRLDGAIAAAQNAAEALKGCGGDYERACALAGGSWDGLCWTITGADHLLRVTPAGDDPLLGEAELWAGTAEGDTLFEMTIAWQREGADHG